MYLDASALVKRYVVEPGSDGVHAAMARADGWFMCRVGFVETFRAVRLAAGEHATTSFRDEWPAFDVIDVDAALSERAAALTVGGALRSLDALHLAAALLLPREALTVATWDRRLYGAALDHGLRVLPATLV